MEQARLLISSRNYSSWSLRGFLLARLAGLDFRVERVDIEDAVARAELLLQASSIRIPCLLHEDLRIWDTMAIAGYLDEIRPEAGLLPRDRAARARCRSISGEMHAGFQALRASLPMNLRAHRQGFRVWAGPRADIDRILSIWRDCLGNWGGPWLFGESPCMGDAMYAPVVTRFLTYDVKLEGGCAAYARTVMEWAPMAEWVAAAKEEPEPPIHELEVEAEF
ncbi:glutathione S-transferase [Roseomonas sp. SSH11]|uniref:Glutathione S-transferase n=1 Tax=Pararoseomonas baculiformis TaxID=2820812 RepID=A0ABS4ADX6_9PROT|nr:glutathione S-transferase [Pararoseomonas baculiformis]MBP0445221.1 glutathione S-transferase [Pararoseomonas baculiformis]